MSFQDGCYLTRIASAQGGGRELPMSREACIITEPTTRSQNRSTHSSLRCATDVEDRHDFSPDRTGSIALERLERVDEGTNGSPEGVGRRANQHGSRRFPPPVGIANANLFFGPRFARRMLEANIDREDSPRCFPGACSMPASRSERGDPKIATASIVGRTARPQRASPGRIRDEEAPRRK
jgi:hypothetical protein